MHYPDEKAQLAALILATAALAGCDNSAGPEVAAVPIATPEGKSSASFLRDNTPSDVGCGESGALNSTLYGALAGDVDWRSEDMQCYGMPRLEGRGARLRFAGNAGANAMPITFIIALPDLERGTVATELPSNVTVIEERNSRFFSTSDLESCWTDVETQSGLDDSGDRFAIDGILYCISPLPEVNGNASVSIPELRFSGQLDWSAK